MRLCWEVTFAYPGGAEILRGLDLELAPGGRLALTGPSGSGKSTLLALLAGLLTPSAGSVERLRVSMVFQENRLPPFLTALEQLRLVAPEEDPQKLRELLAELDLPETKRPKELSGGMQRRVALARAAAFGAPLWLLDEPFTGLDEASLRRAAGFVLRHLPKDGMLIAALHKREEAELLHAVPAALSSLQHETPRHCGGEAFGGRDG